ncbi:adenylate/guanylate cyclase domain-containing protein [Marinobacterium sp. AK62]|uniref:Adenylate/guanylate cyclase domain-containing protein n=1 Tax=Marinobacterium alkalitolerans TaxID=1542925 RepID=A0ABS3ZDD2_9GAMM|nr:adenylate/guanylate cyclase domain-containing protein [Marinobacterium alkalitolerans]MBP0049716.1 adenylate/guanylate cyclase domain-containing protein [Marinobacterium alkalitolerans]
MSDVTGKRTREHTKAFGMVWLITGFLMLAILIQISPPQLLQRTDNMLYDLWLPHNQTRQVDPRILIIDLDDYSLHKHGRWPWPRAKLAQLVNKILAQPVTALGLDILLPEPSAPAADAHLRQALNDPRVVVATAFALTEETAPSEHDWPLASQNIGLSNSLTSQNNGVTYPALGHITPHIDSDGSIRQLSPIICMRQTDSCIPTLAAEMLIKMTGQSIQVTGEQDKKICIARLCQTVHAGSLLIPFRNNLTIRHVSAADILEGNFNPAMLAGAAVFIGTSAAGLGDLVATPLHPQTPGVQVHAHLLSAWLDDYQLRQAYQSQKFELGLLCLATSLLFCWLHAIPYSRILFFSTLGTVFIFIGYHWHSQSWFSPVTSTLIMLWAGSGAGINSLGTLLKERRLLKQSFTHYVPPVVLEELYRQSSPSKALDASRKEVSVLFADIRGFTQLSEQLPPEQLAELTNKLFTQLTNEVFAHQGTLDKFLGDALMAFWGAPIDQPDHATKAVTCALKMQHRVTEINPWLQARGLPALSVSIGIETGLVVVGNLGSAQRLAYTVLGKAANTAARIQTTASNLKQPILIGPQTHAATQRLFKNHHICQVQLKGLSQPVDLFAPDQPTHSLQETPSSQAE